MFKPVEYNLDMRDPDNWHEVCRNQPKDIIAYIPGANLHEQELLDGATSIGKLYSPKKAGFDVYFEHKEYPGISRVTNEKDEDGKFVGLFPESELGWHNNGNWRHWKHVIESCIAFYCVRPGEQVVTSYLNSHQAYVDLPDELKEQADKFEYWAQFDKDNSIYQFDDDSLNKGMDELLAIFEGNLKATGRKNNDTVNPVRGSWKPLIVQHPYRTIPSWWDQENSPKAIYTGHFGVMRKLRNKETGEEITLEEAKPLLSALHKHLFQPQYMYHHHWKTGDLIINDQFMSYHARNAVKGDRLLYRIAFNYKFLKEA